MANDAFMDLLAAMKKQQEDVGSGDLAYMQNPDSAASTQVRKKKKHIPEHWLLVLKSAVAGMQFYVTYSANDKRMLLSLEPGTELRLERDYQNEHDKWAISIYTLDGRMLGYMTRYKNETIARLMDYGKRFHAIVDKPVELPRDPEELREVKTPTENYKLPYSVYMEEEGYEEEGEEA